MAGIRFSKLVDAFINRLEISGATVIREKIKDNVRPARIRVNTGNGATDCLVFLWTITLGGGGVGVRPPNERRIQMTNIKGMPLQPGVRTLLGGWNPEHEAYAFWDARRHTVFSRKSSSLQVDRNVLETASSIGIASQRKPTSQGQEVVVAVAPTSLLWYVENGSRLHNAEDDWRAIEDLADTSPEEERAFLDSADSEIASARRYDLVETMRAYRDAKFRPAVLHAFQYKCAVCDTDLKLVDAAHIVPVSYPTSTDEVTNGLALCGLHHTAYDNALLGVLSNYRLVVNPETVDRLNKIGLGTAIDSFKRALPEEIRVPSSIEARPRSDNLKLGLQIRRWPSSFIA